MMAIQSIESMLDDVHVDVPKLLLEDIKNERVVLFVGSGLSCTVQLPSWEKLISFMGKKLGYDQALFLKQASIFQLAEYYALQMGSLQELCAELHQLWHTPSTKAAVKASLAYNCLAKIPWHAIYTTNYDWLLEWAFEHAGLPFGKVVRAADFACIEKPKTPIVKLHGDLSDQSTIVLEESKYFERLSLDSPLDIRFRADVLDKTVLFIGYSLTDANIRLLFYRLHRMWASQGIGNRPRSYIFMPQPKPIQSAVLQRWGIETINAEHYNQTASLTRFLQLLAQ